MRIALALMLMISSLAWAGLTVIQEGKVTNWDDGTPIPAGKAIFVRLYGAKQGAPKLFLDSALTADRLKFARPTASSATISCYDLTSWVDQNADGLVQPIEESVHTSEVCGTGTDPIVIKKPAAPSVPTVEAP